MLPLTGHDRLSLRLKVIRVADVDVPIFHLTDTPIGKVEANYQWRRWVGDVGNACRPTA